MRNQALKNKSLRRKITASIDINEIITIIFDSKATQANQLFIKNNKFYSKPKKELRRIGRYDPIRKIILHTNPEKENILIAKAIAKDLQSKKTAASVKPVEWGQFKKDIIKNKIRHVGTKYQQYKFTKTSYINSIIHLNYPHLV